MTTGQRTWISPDAYQRLQQELATLREQCIIGAGTGDTDDQHRRQARIHQIHDLLVDTVVGDDPVDDGIAEPGMVLTVRYEDTGDIDTFLLGVRGAEYGDIEVYSNQSPLGAAIAGARILDRRSYTLPSGVTLTVTLLHAVPYAVYASSPA